MSCVTVQGQTESPRSMNAMGTVGVSEVLAVAGGFGANSDCAEASVHVAEEEEALWQSLVVVALGLFSSSSTATLFVSSKMGDNKHCVPLCGC